MTLKTKIASLILLLGMTYTNLAVAEDRENVITVYSIEYPPFTSTYLPDFGLNIRLLSDYAKKHYQIKPEPKFLPPARVKRILDDGNWCLSIYPPGRENGDAVFVPLTTQEVRLGLYRRTQNSSFQWQGLNELRGHHVAIFRSVTQGGLYDQFKDAGLTLQYIDTLEQGFKLLLHGRVSYLFADELAVDNDPFATDRRALFQFSQSTILSTKIGFFYNKNCLADLLQKTKNDQ